MMFGSAPQKKFLNAAESGDMAELNRCLAQEIPSQYDINVRGPNGRTALILAAKAGAVDTLKLLLAKKPDLEIADSSGRTALWWACCNSRTEAVKLLVSAGADVNTHDNNYYYPLHYSARNGDLDSVKALAAAGADLNVATRSYLQTPLHMAVENRRNPEVQFLLDQGARTDLKDSNNYIAWERAKAIGSKALQEMIESAQKRAARVPMPAAIPAPAAAQPAKEPVAGESWILVAPDTLAHINVYPPIGRKLTEIFNFTARERTVITENLKTGAETMTTAERFETLSPDVLARAEEKWKSLDGALPDKAAKKAFNL
jgi:uncharacterized protein